MIVLLEIQHGHGVSLTKSGNESMKSGNESGNRAMSLMKSEDKLNF